MSDEAEQEYPPGKPASAKQNSSAEEEVAASSDPTDSSAFFRGTVTRVTFRNLETGFGVVKVEADLNLKDPAVTPGGLVTVVGIFPSTLAAGTYFIARGQWQTHAKFGRQFRAYSVTETDPAGPEAIERYLGSGSIKGFGPVLAKRVVDYFGETTLKIIDENPQRLKEVSGIGEKKLQEILTSWREKRNLREIFLFFEGHGIALGLAQRIYNAYGEKAIEITKGNPYSLARDIWGIGFQTADRIARALGISPTSIERIIAGIIYTLERAAEDGHCYLPTRSLITRTVKLLEIEEKDLIAEGLSQAALRGELIEENEANYLPMLHLEEKTVARGIASRIQGYSSPKIAIPNSVVSQTCEQAQVYLGASNETSDADSSHPAVVRLSDEQKQAVALAASSPLMVITGGPGCGKTTVVRAITQLFRRANLKAKLAAPTGRAAQRLSEICDMPASTIHRLLHFDPISRSFQHDEHSPLDIDALIVDESSMIDIPLAASLLKAIPPGARVIFVGDADQLPSVGPGLFLGDLLQIEDVPRVRLTTLFRRADQSSITVIAHKINSSMVPHIPQPDGTVKSDAYFLPAQDPEAAAQLIERLVVEQIPRKFNFQASDISVLSPMNKGPLGVLALNQRLQSRLVPTMPGLPQVKVGNLEFRLGDKVCQRVNNYNLHANGVFNGEQGEIIGIDAEAKSVYVRLWDKREISYPADTLYQLDLAYALTIHRSQGSEVPVVILAVHDSHTIMLERQLIYTGITRAKKLLIVVGTKRALVTATKRVRSRKRYTKLSERTGVLLEL